MRDCHRRRCPPQSASELYTPATPRVPHIQKLVNTAFLSVVILNRFFSLPSRRRAAPKSQTNTEEKVQEVSALLQLNLSLSLSLVCCTVCCLLSCSAASRPSSHEQKTVYAFAQIAPSERQHPKHSLPRSPSSVKQKSQL